VKVSAKAGATINNIASVSSSTLDPNPGNNSATVSTAVVANTDGISDQQSAISDQQRHRAVTDR